MVRAVRRKPFGEWNVVYYDASRTDISRIEERLKSKGCREAERVGPATREKDGIQVVVDNPLAAPGDFFVISVKLPGAAAGKLALEPPEGWSSAGVPAEASRGIVTSPDKARAGQYAITARVTAGSKETEVTLEVELVSLVK